jgi:hypothetical protein
MAVVVTSDGGFVAEPEAAAQPDQIAGGGSSDTGGRSGWIGGVPTGPTGLEARICRDGRISRLWCCGIVMLVLRP